MTDFFSGGEGRLRPANAAVALIVIDGENYLMQLRDQKSGIFYPDHWGLFGGAVDAGESPDQTLRRELEEELGLTVETVCYFTEFTFDFEFSRCGRLTRRFFEVPLERTAPSSLILREGAAMRIFSAREILTMERVVPYDAFAIWLHAIGRRAFVPQ
jgi:8-oxo-dGTP pyrophosphatase MutT (NUDIX family)